MSKTIYIGGRLESKEKGNVVAGANAILDDTKGKKQNVINKETDDELLRLEQSKQDNLTFDNAPTEDSTNPVTSGGVYTAEKALSDAIEAILLLIPSAATALNKLVDTNTMNSSISTATATFRGTYNAVTDLGLSYQATHAQIEAALDALGLTADNNDYAFVQVPVSDQSQDIAKTERYKNNGTNWQYEYDLNTSGFTAAQWAAINSGITVALVTKLTDLPTAAALQLALNAKQDTLTFDTEPTALSQNPVTSGGIYTAIQAIATALSDYETATDGRLNILEGLIPSEAASNNKLTDKAYVDGLIQAITELIPAEATTSNQLADKAYVLASILAATPAFKGQFTTLAELQAVASPKDGDLGIVRTKDSDGMDVFTVYQYLNNAWGVFYSLSYHPQTKPATTGTTGDYPYNGMGRVELAKNMVNTGTDLEPVMVNTLTQDMFYKGAVGSRVPNTNTIFVIRYDYVLAENITIPDGCVLEFEGGSISGAYTLTGANTEVVVTGNYNPFSATLAGTFSQINPADKPYTSGNGMGVVYLKKGVSLASQLTQTNTIYVCQYDYTLAANITLPANSILRFEGGSIDSNYTITLSDGCKVEGGKITLSESGSIIIGGDSVTIEGCEIHKDNQNSENNGSQYSPTYQAIFGNGKNYLTFKNNNIFLTNIGSFTTLISCSYVDVLNNHIKNTTFNPAEGGDRTCGVELCDDCQYVRIHGNTIENTMLPIAAFANEQKVSNLQILGNTILNSYCYGICIYNAHYQVENVVIDGNIIKNVYGGDSYGAGIYLLESTNIVVSDNYIENTAVNTTVSGTLAPAGIGLNTSNHCTLSNNIIKTSKYYGIILQGSNNLTQGNNIYDCPTSIEVRNLSYSRIENNIMDRNISVVSAITDVSIEQNTCLCIGWDYRGTNGHNIHICRNIMKGSTGFDGFLLYINDSNTDVVIDGNIFDGDCSSAIWGGPTNSVYTNNILLCTPTGINMQYNAFGSGAFLQNNYIKNIKTNDVSPMNYTKSGASSDRPAHPTFGMMYKDTTLGKPIWFDGTNWVDATGATV